MGNRTRVVTIGQNVWQLAHYFHTPDNFYVFTCTNILVICICKQCQQIMFNINSPSLAFTKNSRLSTCLLSKYCLLVIVCLSTTLENPCMHAIMWGKPEKV